MDSREKWSILREMRTIELVIIPKKHKVYEVQKSKNCFISGSDYPQF